MTIGEKIKYCRHRYNITQAKLAELSGVSLVSIKRYESNKTIPVKSHIEKLADALGIGSFAFSDMNIDFPSKMETYGDLIGLLMFLRKIHVVAIDGTRDDDGRLVPNTATFSIAPMIGKVFQSSVLEHSVEDIQLSLKSQNILDGLLKWESVYNKYEHLSEKYKDDEKAQTTLTSIEEDLAVIELEMQCNSTLLERVKDTPVVKIASDKNKAKPTRAKKQQKKNGDDDKP